MSAVRSPAAAWRWQWSWLWGSPLLWALWACTLIAAVVGQRIRRATEAAEATRLELGDALAGLAAESVAAAIAAGRVVVADGTTGRLSWPTGPATDAVVRAERHGADLLLRVAIGDGREHHLACALLPGGAPRLLGLPFTAVAGREPFLASRAPCLVARAELPELCPTALAGAARLPLPSAIVRDAAIALLHLPAGTERDDYRLGVGCGANQVDVPPGGVLVVPGHLWVDRGPAALRLQLADDLTIVVRGNAYFGRSVQVSGPGRLLVVTLTGDSPPAAHVREPLEGVGKAILGLPGRGGRIELELGLVVGGELDIAADRARVDGPLVLHQGMAALGSASAGLDVTGRRLPDPDRQVVPGFRTTGPPRPGLLRLVATTGTALPAAKIPGAPQQPLYEPMPAR